MTKHMNHKSIMIETLNNLMFAYANWDLAHFVNEFYVPCFGSNSQKASYFNIEQALALVEEDDYLDEKWHKFHDNPIRYMQSMDDNTLEYFADAIYMATSVNTAIVKREDVPEKREELLWEEKFDFITEDGNEVDSHQKLCNVESDNGSIVDIEIVHHTSNRGTDFEYWELFVDGHITPNNLRRKGYSYWLYGDVEEAVYEVIEKRGLVVKLPV